MSQGCFFQPTRSVELEASGRRVLSPRGCLHTAFSKTTGSLHRHADGLQKPNSRVHRSICSCARPSSAAETIPTLHWESNLHGCLAKWENGSEGTMKTMTGRVFSRTGRQNIWSGSPSEYGRRTRYRSKAELM